MINGYLDWADISHYDDISDDYLRVEPGCDIRIRLIGSPAKMVYVLGYDNIGLCIDNEDVGRQLEEKYGAYLRVVSVQYLCWCIDRESNSLKILGMPASVAEALSSREALVGRQIASIDEGCDWIIVSNGLTGENIRYETVYLEETPLSQAETDMVNIRVNDGRGIYDVFAYLNSYSFAEAEEELFGW